MDSRSSQGGRLRTLPAGSGQTSDALDVRTGSRPKLESANESAPPPEHARSSSIGTTSEGSQRIRSLPPVDPTVARPSAKPSPRATAPTPKPILASECLRDDAAPIEPNDRAGRGWSLGFGAAMIACALGLMPRALPFGSDVGAQRAMLGTALLGAVVVGSSLALRRYAARAVALLALVVLGAFVFVVMQGQSALLFLRWLAPAPLVAALFLRVAYRSDKLVRALLGVSIVAFLVAACFVGGSSIFADAAPRIARLVAGAMGIVAGLSLLGFMGEETTAGCTAWGWLAMLLGVSSLAVDGLVRGGAPSWLALLGIALATPVAAIGIYQLVASAIGPRLRVLASARTSMPAPAPREELDRDRDESLLPGDD